jgi:hypothetical protein
MKKKGRKEDVPYIYYVEAFLKAKRALEQEQLRRRLMLENTKTIKMNFGKENN